MQKPIDLSALVEAYHRSKARLILLDHDGTLIGSDLYDEMTIPAASLRDLLTVIAADQSNDAIVISGRDRDYLDTIWSGVPITLAAEHGGYYKKPGGNWNTMLSASVDWIQKTISAIKALEFHFEGSFVEQKSYSIIWHYKAIANRVTESDRRQILAAIRSLPERDHFLIYNGEFSVELRTIGIDKGSFTSFWARNKYYDFTMAIGDGQTDEDLFNILGKEAYSIRVGRSINSAANYYLKDQQEVFPLLSAVLNFHGVADNKLN